MNSKILLLSVAVVAIGLFAMPSTLSLFAGQHTFVNGSEVKCNKCHSDIASEMSSGGGTAHTNPRLQACEGCHRTNSSALTSAMIPYNGTSNLSAGQWAGTNVSANANAHAAVTMECIGCHAGVDEELTGGDAAHTSFFYNATYYNGTGTPGVTGNQTALRLKGANTACIGCHTHAMINITWIRSIGYNVTATSNATSGWDMTFSLNSSVLNTTYSAGEAGT